MKAEDRRALRRLLGLQPGGVNGEHAVNDIDELRTAARNAAELVGDQPCVGQPPWTWVRLSCEAADRRRHRANVFIGACSPDIVLGLLRHVDELRAGLEEASAALQRAGLVTAARDARGLLEKDPTR